MHHYLKEQLVCPVCKGPLIWEIGQADAVHIIDAQARCGTCGKVYVVEREVGCFLPEPGGGDSWSQLDGSLAQYWAEHPQAREQLLSTPAERLNAADLRVRSALEQEMGNAELARELEQQAYLRSYTPQAMEAHTAQLDFTVRQLTGKAGFVVDIASGLGRLVRRLYQDTDLPIVATDLSYYVMKQTQADHPEYRDRVSYMACDANLTPFRDRSVPYMTSLLGLQNIPDAMPVLWELARICSGEFYPVCLFCPEGDQANLSALTQMGMDLTWVEGRLMDGLCQAGWACTVENARVARVEPTPVGEIVKGFAIDGFPVAPSEFKYCTLQASKL